MTKTPNQTKTGSAELSVVTEWREARTAATGWTPSSVLYEDFRLWCQRVKGVPPGLILSMNRWSRELTRLGVQKFRNSKAQRNLVLHEGV